MPRYGEKGEINVDMTTQITLGCNGCPNQCRILATDRLIGMAAVNLLSHQPIPPEGPIPYTVREQHIVTVRGDTSDDQSMVSSYQPYLLNERGACRLPCSFTQEQMAGFGDSLVADLQECTQDWGTKLVRNELITDKLTVKDRTEN